MDSSAQSATLVAAALGGPDDAIDEARGARRDDGADDAADAWNALVEGRCSIVDTFESDGRRHLVVRKNPPEVAARVALTARERRVVAYAAMGHANKLIAYELGLCQSAVSTALRSAAAKLGARSRIELVRMLARVAR